jgi:hypothetical protein
VQHSTEYGREWIRQQEYLELCHAWAALMPHSLLTVFMKTVIMLPSGGDRTPASFRMRPYADVHSKHFTEIALLRIGHIRLHCRTILCRPF